MNSFLIFNTKLKYITILVFSFFISQAQYPAGSPVAINGKLSIKGTHLVNECGNVVQLKGMSTHGIQWFGNCLNANSVQALAKDWKADILRLAMYIQEGGYASNPSYYKTVIDNLVNECEKQGIYVIIDFHVHIPGDPMSYLSDSKEFWDYMATKHKNKKHVLYEICNEPNGVTWTRVKEYANIIIPRIRAIDASTPIICGSSRWSQDLDSVAVSPLPYTNILYSFHFYAGTHTQTLRARVDYAIAKGVPVIVTEWGTNDVNSAFEPDLVKAAEWLNWLNENKISWMNWSFSDKNESSAALTSGACGSNMWNSTTTSGTFIKSQISQPKEYSCSTNPYFEKTNAYNSLPAKIPGRIQAEYFDNGKNFGAFMDLTTANRGAKFRDTEVDIEETLDNEGNYDIGYIQANEWLSYTTEVTESGLYDFGLRLGCNVTNGKIHIEVNDVNVTGSVALPYTGGFQKWQTVPIKGINLKAGLNVIKIVFETIGYNFNYFEAYKQTGTPVVLSSPTAPSAYNATAGVIPGRLEAEYFDLGGINNAYYDIDLDNKGGQLRTTEYVDIQTTKDSIGKFNIGWVNPGEWLKYTVNISSAGIYSINPRVSNTVAGSAMHFELDGVDISGTINLPANTAWKTVKVPNITLPSGTHTFKIVFHTSGFNINYVDFVKTANTNEKPTVSLTAPITNSTFTSPASVVISASASDADGTISSVSFYNGTTLLSTVTTAPYTFTWSNVAAGSYTISAIATDNSGANTTSNVATILVQNPNIAPTVTITNPTTGTNIYSGSSLTLSASANDTDGSISSVKFYVNGVFIAEDLTSPYESNWSPITVGTYQITAVSTDNLGSTSASELVNISVKEKPANSTCYTENVPIYSKYSLLDDWNDQSSGSMLTNENSALKITHRTWANPKFWVTPTQFNVDVVSGKNYAVKFDFANDVTNPVAAIELATTNSLQWNAPTTIQSAIATLGLSNSSTYNSITANFASNYSGKIGVAFQLKLNAQPNAPVYAYIKNIEICEISTSTARLSNSANEENNLVYLSTNISENSFQLHILQNNYNQLKVTVKDITGTTVLLEEYNSNSDKIEFGEKLPNGFYLVTTEINSQKYFFKILK
ncbi:MAG: cellulase family glycosylhydrolase [Cytophagales bacterium]